MRFRLCIGSLLLAWLCASGALLDTAQVFAWARMCAGYARRMPLSTAITRTFDPDQPCALCKAVQKARASSHTAKAAPAASAEMSKMALVAHLVAPTPPLSAPQTWPAGASLRAETRADPVPVPPPRERTGSSLA